MKNKITTITLTVLLMFSVSNLIFADLNYYKQYKKAMDDRDFSQFKNLVESGKVKINSFQYTYKSKLRTASPLAYACSHYDYKAALYLIQKGANVKGRYGSYSALWYAVTVARSKYGWYERFAPVIKILLEKGADPNDGGRYRYYPLNTAASRNNMELVKLLLKYGAKKEAVDYYEMKAADYAEKYGYTEMANFLRGNLNDAFKNTLFYAAKKGDLKKAFKILKEAGSKAKDLVKKTDGLSGYTALHYAAKYGHYEIAKLLISYGAPIDTQAVAARTPLMEACLSKSSKIALLLVKLGANPNVTQSQGCGYGLTPFFWAMTKGLHDVVKAMWDTKKVNVKILRNYDKYFKLTSYNTIKLVAEYCKIKPTKEYIQFLKNKEYDEKYELFYINAYRYFKSKGYFK